MPTSSGRKEQKMHGPLCGAELCGQSFLHLGLPAHVASASLSFPAPRLCHDSTDTNWPGPSTQTTNSVAIPLQSHNLYLPDVTDHSTVSTSKLLGPDQQCDTIQITNLSGSFFFFAFAS